jgi:hypothetical protein
MNIEEYHELHRACPKCNEEDIVTTCLGIIANDWTDVKDTNRAECINCGWKGIFHDLVPKDSNDGV